MALPNTYLITTKNLDNFFNTIITAQAPERFSQKFLENLEFKSTNDRLFIGLLKALGFIDDGGIPTQKYYNFLDQSQSKVILAQAIKEAYSDLFVLRKDAQNLTSDEVKNKMRSLTQGQKSDKVLTLMSNTFKALCEYADWTETINEPVEILDIKDDTKVIPSIERNQNFKLPSLNYNIQIHLPETRDSSVYDAIFKSLKEHLFI